MSFEVTMVCDGCSTVIDGGQEGAMSLQLVRQGGRVITMPRPRRERHLCPACVRERRQAFFDGLPVPWPGPAPEPVPS